MDKIVKIQVWDTAGQERYRSITNAYYRGAEGILIVFDLTNQETFKNIQKWINDVTVYTGKDVIFLCLGNKSDLKKGLDKKTVEEFIKKTNLEIFNVSAKTLCDKIHLQYSNWRFLKLYDKIFLPNLLRLYFEFFFSISPR